MATLKMCSDHSNKIWLPDVRRVEEMFYFYPADFDDINHTPVYPWEALNHVLAKTEKRCTAQTAKLLPIIAGRIGDYENRASMVSVDGVERFLLLHVVIDRGDDVKCENWLVAAGQNYLLENGKTIDRI